MLKHYNRVASLFLKTVIERRREKQKRSETYLEKQKHIIIKFKLSVSNLKSLFCYEEITSPKTFIIKPDEMLTCGRNHLDKDGT